MEVSETNEKKWFALYIKPQQEFKASANLGAKEIEYYMPTISVVKQWRDRKKKIIEPIIRGYIFINTDEKGRLIALQSSAVVRTVSFQGKPAVIPAWEIENLKRFLSESRDFVVSNKLEIGTKVKITEGPFHDVVGVVTGSQEDKWLAVSIDLLKRSVMVRLPQESVVKVLENDAAHQ